MKYFFLIFIFLISCQKDVKLNPYKLNTVIRDGMTVKSIMADFMNLLESKYDYNQVPIGTLKKSFKDFDEFDPALKFYLLNFTPKESFSFLGTTVLTINESLELMESSWPLDKLKGFGLLPISKGVDYKYDVVDVKTGKTYLINSSIYFSEEELQMLDWEEPKAITKENVLLAAEEDFEVCDNVFDQYITYVIDLEIEE